MSGWYTPKPVVQNKGKQTSIDLSVLSRLRITLDCTPNDLLKHVLGNEDKAIRMALKGRVETPKPLNLNDEAVVLKEPHPIKT